jgi:hypothetical protein
MLSKSRCVVFAPFAFFESARSRPAHHTPAAHMLTARALNRALLARQLLLERAPLDPVAAAERLVGLQAQVPNGPYVSLWSRLAGFTRDALGAALLDRSLVRGTLMRGTVHLVSAPDYLALRPLVQPVVARMIGSTAFARATAAVPREALLAAARALLEERPRTRAELGRLLAERWPGVDPLSLASLLPTVQVTPRGVWGASAQATVTTPAAWLGRPLDPAPSAEAMLLRYLAAHGPASVRDAQSWCGVTRLREVAERLRPRLRAFRDAHGVELLDLPDAPRPDPDTPAPPRFLHEYDNALLGFADRTRVVPATLGAVQFAGGAMLRGTLLVDGFVAGLWSIARDGDAATLTVETFAPARGADRVAVEEEGARMLAFFADDAGDRDVRLTS